MESTDLDVGESSERNFYGSAIRLTSKVTLFQCRNAWLSVFVERRAKRGLLGMSCCSILFDFK